MITRLASNVKQPSFRMKLANENYFALICAEEHGGSSIEIWGGWFLLPK